MQDARSSWPPETLLRDPPTASHGYTATPARLQLDVALAIALH